MAWAAVGRSATAPIAYEVTYPASPAAVLDLVTSEAFLEDYASAIGALRWDADVTRRGDARMTELDFAVPTDGIPAVFRRFVGSEIGIRDRRSWAGSAGDAHQATLAVDAAMKGRQARVRGGISLTADPAGARFAVTGTVDVQLPPVSGMAAAQLVRLVCSVLQRESAVVNNRL